MEQPLNASNDSSKLQLLSSFINWLIQPSKTAATMEKIPLVHAAQPLKSPGSMFYHAPLRRHPTTVPKPRHGGKPQSQKSTRRNSISNSTWNYKMDTTKNNTWHKYTCTDGRFTKKSRCPTNHGTQRTIFHYRVAAAFPWKTQQILGEGNSGLS